jgi:thiol-disulfide isomerase/thioredoxin
MALLLPACYAQQTQYAEIKGTVKTEKQLEIRLSAVENGSTQVFATTNTAPDGSFTFTFVPTYAGFYTVGIGRMDYLLYLQAGDKANIDIQNRKITLVGTNTKENIELYKWLDASNDVHNNSVYFTSFQNLPTYTEFFPAFEKLAAQAGDIKKSVNSGNASFDNLLKTFIDYDLDYNFLSYLYSPRPKHPGNEDRIPFYETIVSKEKFASDDVLKFPKGLNMLKIYLMFNRIEKKAEMDASLSAIAFDFEYVPNATLRGEYLLSALQGFKSHSKFEEFTQAYGKYLTTPEQKSKAETIASKLSETATGSAASDLSYPDNNGKTISLSDFKGKVVVIDVWATWCGPCRKQFPFLKALEKKMHGKDVVFIGVSIDAEKDKEKWKAMIKSEDLPGIHLYAGSGNSKIAKDYKINSIPRYLVFDKKGNIVSADAPRPEDKELEEILEKELSRN